MADRMVEPQWKESAGFALPSKPRRINQLGKRGKERMSEWAKVRQQLAARSGGRCVTILPYRLPRINFDMYQKAITDFAVYPEKNTGGVAALSYCGLGLGGETGEVLEHLKKIQRDNNGEVSPERREALSKELGDVLWYLCRLASELGLEMNVVALDNIEKLQSRLERNVIQGDGDNR